VTKGIPVMRYLYAPAALLVLVCLACAGCEGPGFAAYVIAGPPKIKAKYTLEKRPTLVIVDDPRNTLGNPNYPVVVGANVGFHLQGNKALLPEQVVSQDRLSVLASQMGNRYPLTPIDQIGARLGADQVIHVMIRSASMRADNTYYQPTAAVEVKVIDTRTGKRLFPEADGSTGTVATRPGQSLSVALPRQTLDETRRHALPTLARDLAERVGQEVAQLFYQHVAIDDSLID
jgi:hypothetical protein